MTFFDCPVLSFFSRSCAQVEPLDRFSRFMAQTMCFCARMVLLGLEQWVTIFGGNMPPKPPKMGVNRQFQAKMAKYTNKCKKLPFYNNVYDPSFVTRIKRQKFNFINSGPVDIIYVIFQNWMPISDSMFAILKNRYDVITPPKIVRVIQNLAGRCKMTRR